MTSTSQEIRPRRVWYAVAVAVLLCGITVFAILLVGFIMGIGGLTTSMNRVVAPGTVDINLDEPGSYTIFNEYQSVVDGRVYNNPVGLGGLTCTLNEKATGRSIPLTASTGGSYSSGSYAGRSVFDFSVPSAGVYTLSAEYVGGAAGPQTVLAVGHNFMGRLFGLILRMFAAVGTLVVSILLAVLIFIITIVRRSIAKRRLRESVA